MSEPSAVPGPAPLPLIGWVGNAIQNAMQPLQRGLASQQRYGNLCGVVAGSQRFVLAFGATHNRAVLTQPDIFYTNDAATLPIKLPQKTALWRNWDNGLLQMNGARHDRQRRLMMPAMHKKRLDGYRDDIIHLTERQMQTWTPGSTRRMLDEMRELTMAVAIKILLGLDPEHEGKIMRAVVEQFTGLIQSPATMAMPINLPGTPFRRLIRVSEQWENEAKAMIARKRASGIDGGDALAMLMQVHDEDGSRMTDEELIGQTGTLFIAGHETTATALTWTLFLLAQHPQVLRALRDELAALGGDAPALDQPLPLLDGVIKESLRLFPPLNLLMRVATSPFELGGYALPAGANIVLSGFVTHRIEPVYDQPYRFMPERWQTINPSPYEFMPFGGGARMCIGAPFAMMEMKLVLPLLLQRYQFTLLPKSHIDAAGLIFTTPKNHLPMRIDLISGQLPERVQVQGNVTQFVRLESA